MCCHLPGEMLNSAAECADRARIGILPYGENGCGSKSTDLNLTGFYS
jgi:hypothetical protein